MIQSLLIAVVILFTSFYLGVLYRTSKFFKDIDVCTSIVANEETLANVLGFYEETTTNYNHAEAYLNSKLLTYVLKKDDLE